MNSLLDNTDEEDDLPLRSRNRASSQDREITLGTTMILLIFFALAVYGAALFGFGYSLGSKRSAGTPAPLAIAPGTGVSTGNAKPSPSSLAGSAAKPAAAGPTVVPYTPPSGNDAPIPIAKPEPEAAESPRPAPPEPVAATVAPAANATPAPPGSGPAIVVQVAAVSHQEDAQMIASTLQRRGYTVSVRSEPDKLFHVQIGPFYARKDADAMKARLLADGFNAYIK